MNNIVCSSGLWERGGCGNSAGKKRGNEREREKREKERDRKWQREIDR